MSLHESWKNIIKPDSPEFLIILMENYQPDILMIQDTNCFVKTGINLFKVLINTILIKGGIIIINRCSTGMNENSREVGMNRVYPDEIFSLLFSVQVQS